MAASTHERVATAASVWSLRWCRTPRRRARVWLSAFPGRNHSSHLSLFSRRDEARPRVLVTTERAYWRSRTVRQCVRSVVTFGHERHASALSRSQTGFTNGVAMAGHQRTADWAADEVADVRDVVSEALRVLDTLVTSGVVSLAQICDVRALLTRAEHEAEQAECASEFVSIGELWSASGLTGGPNAHIRRRALEVVERAKSIGLQLPNTGIATQPAHFWYEPDGASV